MLNADLRHNRCHSLHMARFFSDESALNDHELTPCDQFIQRAFGASLSQRLRGRRGPTPEDYAILMRFAQRDATTHLGGLA